MRKIAAAVAIAFAVFATAACTPVTVAPTGMPPGLLT